MSLTCLKVKSLHLALTADAVSRTFHNHLHLEEDSQGHGHDHGRHHDHSSHHGHDHGEHHRHEGLHEHHGHAERIQESADANVIHTVAHIGGISIQTLELAFNATGLLEDVVAKKAFSARRNEINEKTEQESETEFQFIIRSGMRK